MTYTSFTNPDGTIQLDALPEAALTASALGRALSKINRHAGQTSEPWSAAAHSVLVSRLCPHKQEQAWGLLHDAHEAFIGDIVTPAVTFIANQNRLVTGDIVESCLHSAKANLDRQIRAAWGIDPEIVDLEEVAHYDRIVFDVEMFWFFNHMPTNTAERPLPDPLAQRKVNSPSRITLENNGKIRPQPDRENAFAGASGGGNGAPENSAGSSGRDLF